MGRSGLKLIKSEACTLILRNYLFQNELTSFLISLLHDATIPKRRFPFDLSQFSVHSPYIPIHLTAEKIPGENVSCSQLFLSCCIVNELIVGASVWSYSLD